MPFRAVVFPGQGAQRRGMAVDFAERFPESRRVFERASEALSFDVEAVCREDDPRLDQTEFTQPCILTAEIAMLAALRRQAGLDAEVYGGHSLGEYAALVAASAVPLEVAVRLVRARGALMQRGAPLGTGAMAAVVMDGLPHQAIEAEAAGHGVDLANDNSPSQVVVSGLRPAVEALCSRLAAMFPGPALRLVPLTVSAPFHSRHMAAAESAFREVLNQGASAFRAAAARTVVSNFTGTWHTGETSDLLEALARQVSGRVRWRQNMDEISRRAETVLELGPGRPLAGFFKTIAVPVTSVVDLRTARRAFPGVFEAPPAARPTVPGSEVNHATAG